MKYYEIKELRKRATNWEVKSQNYSLQGKYDKAGECRTRALKLWGKAETAGLVEKVGAE